MKRTYKFKFFQVVQDVLSVGRLWGGGHGQVRWGLRYEAVKVIRVHSQIFF